MDTILATITRATYCLFPDDIRTAAWGTLPKTHQVDALKDETTLTRNAKDKKRLGMLREHLLFARLLVVGFIAGLQTAQLWAPGLAPAMRCTHARTRTQITLENCRNR